MDLQPIYRADIIHLLPIFTKYHGHPSTASRHIATGGLFSKLFSDQWEIQIIWP